MYYIYTVNPDPNSATRGVHRTYHTTFSTPEEAFSEVTLLRPKTPGVRYLVSDEFFKSKEIRDAVAVQPPTGD